MFQVSNLVDYLRGSADRSTKTNLPRIDTSVARNGDGTSAPPPTPVDAVALPEGERFVPVRLSSSPTETMFYTLTDLEALLAIYPDIHAYPDDETSAELCNYLGWELPESEIVIDSVKWTIIMKMRATIENNLTQLGFVDLHQIDVSEFQGEYAVHAFFCPAFKESIDLPAFLQIPYVRTFPVGGCGCDEEELNPSNAESKSKPVSFTQGDNGKDQAEPRSHGPQEGKIPAKESVSIPKAAHEVSPILFAAPFLSPLPEIPTSPLYRAL